jgi:glucosylceramidase
MKKIIAFQLIMVMALSLSAQKKVDWVASSEAEQWKTQNSLTTLPSKEAADAEVRLNEPMQSISGFGTCFNELGWTSLSFLSPEDRQSIMKELFAPGFGANFSICRMPVGANDFSRNWYSYNETDGDFEMKNFSIKNDL